MTCRHDKGDPACSSYGTYQRQLAQERDAKNAKRYVRRIAELEGRTPDPDEYSIEEYAQIGPHLVLRVKYPSCKRCSFDQDKVLVLLDSTTGDALRWSRIDPHFSESDRGPRESPAPAARFPASAAGWSDAVEYARRKAE